MTSHRSTSPSSDLDNLSGTEIFWRDNFTWFKDQGYQLRPRFAPDWIPSWKGTSKFRLQCEDGYHLLVSFLLGNTHRNILCFQNARVNDAVHVPTGSHVALKKLYKDEHPFEEDIARHLSSDPLSKDSRNHCVPLLDVLRPPPKDGGREIRVLVMPFLRPFDSPIFDTFGEAIECIRQLFEVILSYSLSENASPLIYVRDCSLCMKIVSHIGTFLFYQTFETRSTCPF